MMLRKVVGFLKKEVVLSVAWMVALISGIWVHPSQAYWGYIDWKSLGILWSLMAIVQGLRQNYVFDKMGWVLLGRTKKLWQLNAVLVFLCFFSSMFVTNDVALITFVPFAVLMLKKSRHEEVIVPVVILQTLAANLGSMLTPIGNPQNLYLYGISDLSITAFLGCMLPYSVCAAMLLVVQLFLLKGKGEPINMMSLLVQEKEAAIHSTTENKETREQYLKKTKQRRMRIVAYGLLFLVALLSVMNIVPFELLVASVLIIVGIFEYRILCKVDYILLLTFVGFFIFTGNIREIGLIRNLLQSLVDGREILVGVLASQGISNVPAALLLSGFTRNYRALLVGVNIGGLGTMIASMASLISYKIFANEYPEQKGKYFLKFTVMNIIFLIVLGGEAWLLS